MIHVADVVYQPASSLSSDDMMISNWSLKARNIIPAQKIKSFARTTSGDISKSNQTTMLAPV